MILALPDEYYYIDRYCYPSFSQTDKWKGKKERKREKREHGNRTKVVKPRNGGVVLER